MSSEADCPIDGCTTGRRSDQLMCREHWRMVPRDLQQIVWRTAKAMWAGVEDAAEQWGEARDKAVHAVEAKLEEKKDA